MKVLDIAIKDMTRSFRSAFSLIFMFGVPLLMTGMFYFMFGGQAKASQGFSVPVTKVVVANMDQGSPAFEASLSQAPGGSQVHSLGEMILALFQNKNVDSLVDLSVANSAEAARSMVDSQKAGIAVIIPADFTRQYTDPNGQATLELYQDPTLTLGPGVVRSILSQFMDSLSGARLAVSVVIRQTGNSDPAVIGQVVSQYMGSVPAGDPSAAYLDLHAPAAAQPEPNTMATILSFIMGGMTIFYAFFTGASTAQSIIREDEDGTLPRLFTTPTKQAEVLGGKFLAVGLTVVVQMTILLILGRLIFGIQWGSLFPLALVTAGTVLAAGSFGLFLMSWLKNTKQTGTVLGGVMTITGMLGMIKIFTVGAASTPLWADLVSMLVPQGWAVRGLTQVMDAAAMKDILTTCAVLVVMSVIFFIIGTLRFQKRFA